MYSFSTRLKRVIIILLGCLQRGHWLVVKTIQILHLQYMTLQTENQMCNSNGTIFVNNLKKCAVCPCFSKYIPRIGAKRTIKEICNK
jgi:hypothetical protein